MMKNQTFLAASLAGCIFSATASPVMSAGGCIADVRDRPVIMLKAIGMNEGDLEEKFFCLSSIEGRRHLVMLRADRTPVAKVILNGWRFESMYGYKDKSTVRFSYEPDRPPSLEDNYNMKVTSYKNGAFLQQYETSYRFSGMEKVSVDGCDYDAAVSVRISRFEGGGQTLERDSFSPDFGWILRVTSVGLPPKNGLPELLSILDVISVASTEEAQRYCSEFLQSQEGR